MSSKISYAIIIILQPLINEANIYTNLMNIKQFQWTITNINSRRYVGLFYKNKKEQN